MIVSPGDENGRMGVRSSGDRCPQRQSWRTDGAASERGMNLVAVENLEVVGKPLFDAIVVERWTSCPFSPALIKELYKVKKSQSAYRIQRPPSVEVTTYAGHCQC